MCRPTCNVPVTLLLVLDLTTRKGIFVSYLYSCIAVDLQFAVSRNPKRKKTPKTFPNNNNKVLHIKNRKLVSDGGINIHY